MVTEKKGNTLNVNLDKNANKKSTETLPMLGYMMSLLHGSDKVAPESKGTGNIACGCPENRLVHMMVPKGVRLGVHMVERSERDLINMSITIILSSLCFLPLHRQVWSACTETKEDGKSGACH